MSEAHSFKLEKFACEPFYFFEERKQKNDFEFLVVEELTPCLFFGILPVQRIQVQYSYDGVVVQQQLMEMFHLQATVHFGTREIRQSRLLTENQPIDALIGRVYHIPNMGKVPHRVATALKNRQQTLYGTREVFLSMLFRNAVENTVMGLMTRMLAHEVFRIFASQEADPEEMLRPLPTWKADLRPYRGRIEARLILKKKNSAGVFLNLFYYRNAESEIFKPEAEWDMELVGTFENEHANRVLCDDDRLLETLEVVLAEFPKIAAAAKKEKPRFEYKWSCLRDLLTNDPTDFVIEEDHKQLLRCEIEQIKPDPIKGPDALIEQEKRFVETLQMLFVLLAIGFISLEEFHSQNDFGEQKLIRDHFFEELVFHEYVDIRRAPPQRKRKSR